MARVRKDTDGFEKRTGKPSVVGKGNDAPFRGYINLNLTDDQKSAFDSWSGSASVWEALEFQVADGVNLSLKQDPKSDGFLASGTQRREASPNAGLVVTARGRDAATAWGRLLYCLTLLSRKEKWEETQPLANPDRW